MQGLEVKSARGGYPRKRFAKDFLCRELCVRATIHGQCCTSDVLSFRACEERHNVRDVLDRSVSAKRGDRAKDLAEWTMSRIHIRVDGTWL